MRWLAGTLVIGLLAAGASGQAPTTKVLDCTNAGCHAKEMDHKVLHGPTAVQACDMCHEYHDPARHMFVLKRKGRELCEFCHIDKSGTEGAFAHEPFAKGDCLSCHDPHGAETARLLKKDSVANLCTDCHTDALHGAHVHKPAGDDCLLCHKPHTADFGHMLTRAGNNLCTSCHEAVGQTVTQSQHPHAPATEDCLQCHTPHASNAEKGLKAPVRELCSSCHEQVGRDALGAAHTHSAALEGRACLNCHTAHGSEHANQLHANPVGACLECHQKPIKVDKDRTVRATPELANDALHRHGPIQDGDCAACHTVHGGEQPQLLVTPYSRSFYQPYSADAYALCLRCHSSQVVFTDATNIETNFRNGDRNLHAVHVNKQPMGRSCRACHSTHASRFESQIADTVSYGQWKLPINFKVTETGGSCAPGCHKPASYDRVTPVTAPPLDDVPEPPGPKAQESPAGASPSLPNRASRPGR